MKIGNTKWLNQTLESVFAFQKVHEFNLFFDKNLLIPDLLFGSFALATDFHHTSVLVIVINFKNV